MRASSTVRSRARWLARERASALVLAIVVISVVGLAIAGYLTYVHYSGVKPLCASGSGGCEKVQTSSYSELAGIPVAVLGLAAYVAILASLVVRGERGRFAGALLALSGFGFSVYLTYREVFTIHAICQWCLASAALMTALASLTVVRLLRAPPDARPPDRHEPLA